MVWNVVYTMDKKDGWRILFIGIIGFGVSMGMMWGWGYVVGVSIGVAGMLVADKL